MKISLINEKVFYRFVEFSSRLIKYELLHEEYKLIALNKKEANNLAEKKVKRLANAFLFSINQTSQIIDFEMISSIYFLLNLKKINKKNLDEILKNIYRYKDENIYFQAANIMIIINNMKMRRKLEFSLLISSLLLIKQNYLPIIFHEIDKKDIKKILKNNELQNLIDFIYMYDIQNRKTIGNNENCLFLEADKIIDFLKEQKQHLKECFKVNHVFLYGSLAKKTNHNSSDLDLLVYMSDEITEHNKNQNINKIEEFLSKELNLKIDVLDFWYSLKHAEIKEMNNAIKIF